MLYYHLLCIVSAYLLILYKSVSLSVLLPNVANKRVHSCRQTPTADYAIECFQTDVVS